MKTGLSVVCLGKGFGEGRLSPGSQVHSLSFPSTLTGSVTVVNPAHSSSFPSPLTGYVAIVKLVQTLASSLN